ncbi:hypothetical protein ZIOFF_047068 [Zingiber officinale]|uniref:Uncharacterized protein n=1 Tax=Zingiber officinale TaxID=94328 RepID=A0A8J5FM78_ZINOF|nr:hypothetical protein ZIOFF_047068 [Zingiber officinale]
MAADLERGRYVVVVLFLCCSMILGLQSIAAERPLGSSTVQAGRKRNDRMEDDKPPLLGRLVNSLPKNGSHSHAWPELELGWRVVFLVTTYKSGSIITSTLKKHKISCFGCCEENDNNRTAASGGPYVASYSARNDGAYLSANTPSKGAQTVKPQPIAVPAILVDEIREITKNLVSMVSRLKHENVMELIGVPFSPSLIRIKLYIPSLFSVHAVQEFWVARHSLTPMVLKKSSLDVIITYTNVEGNLRLLAYEFATMGSLHDILHAPPKDAERQLSKKELKKKEMAELDVLLHEMGIANKDSNTAQNETADKKQLEQSSEGEKKESVGAPSENRILKKKKSKKEKSSKEQEEHDQK